jgi:hypothetical protein
MASAFHLPHSLRSEDAAARKPWLDMSSLAYPSRRRAALSVFSESGREGERTPGKSNSYCPVSVRSTSRMTMACGASGTRCGRRIFMRVAGMVQTPASRSNSFQVARRNSPGLVKVKASN